MLMDLKRKDCKTHTLKNLKKTKKMKKKKIEHAIIVDKKMK